MTTISIIGGGDTCRKSEYYMKPRAWRFHMKALCKTFLLLLASFVLASCGGGGGGSHSAFTPPGNDTTIQLVASTTTLPLSPFTVGQEQTDPFPGNFLGSPYISEVTVTWRHNDGQLVSGTSTVNVSVAPTTIISFSTLNSPTGGTDQFHTLLGSGPVNVTAGVATIYVHAGQAPGAGVLTVTGIDPVSSQTITAQVTINVAGAGPGLPSSVIASSGGGVYISGSNGPQSTIVTAKVLDGSNALVPNPNGFDNVQFQIVGPSTSDARLSGTNASGASTTGTTVSTVTHNGIANVTFQSGTQQGPVQIKATADRSDNNVDNGITDPVSATTTVVVSDGKLYSLTLTSPGSLAPSILINRVSTGVTLINQSTTPIPPDPNATYSFTVSAIGQDRQGNPVLPGTQIKFGSIDSPVDINNNYLISGVHGDPQEGGTTFTATDGHFTTAGGGAGPGDSLLVFGKLVDGNADLESAARIAAVNSATSLTTSTPFNTNDTTGAIVNYGPVLPYIIGRAQIGNITSPASTNSVGVASTTLNYPVSALGHVTAIWAQGTGTDAITGGTDLVTDINLVLFPGVAPGKIVVSPNPIPGNITVPVFACIYDALGSPIAGVQFDFAFTNLGVGSGKLDGISTSGTVPDLTNSSGCVTTTVVTTGIAAAAAGGANGPSLTFSVGATTSGPIPIVASGNLILLAKPSALGGNGGTVTLSLLNSNGTPVPGVQLTGSCQGATVGITSGPGVTNAQGQTTVDITADLNQPNAPGSGSCTFTTSTGSPSVTVTLQGIDPCKSGVSPLPSGCTITPGTPSTVAFSVVSGATTASFTSSPAGASCSGAVGTTQNCPVSLNGGTYTLTPSPLGGTWSGSCTPIAGGKSVLIVPTTTTTGLTCTLTMP
jgi:hypothetical protein